MFNLFYFCWMDRFVSFDGIKVCSKRSFLAPNAPTMELYLYDYRCCDVGTVSYIGRFHLLSAYSVVITWCILLCWWLCVFTRAGRQYCLNSNSVVADFSITSLSILDRDMRPAYLLS